MGPNTSFEEKYASILTEISNCSINMCISACVCEGEREWEGEQENTMKVLLHCMKAICSGSHVSSVADLTYIILKKNAINEKWIALRTLLQNKKSRSWNETFDMCTPRLRCIPEHCMHINIPRFTLAHLGALNRSTVQVQNITKKRNVLLNDLIAMPNKLIRDLLFAYRPWLENLDRNYMDV